MVAIRGLFCESGTGNFFFFGGGNICTDHESIFGNNIVRSTIPNLTMGHDIISYGYIYNS